MKHFRGMQAESGVALKWNIGQGVPSMRMRRRLCSGDSVKPPLKTPLCVFNCLGAGEVALHSLNRLWRFLTGNTVCVVGIVFLLSVAIDEAKILNRNRRLLKKAAV
jgi:hypothetical protein